MTQNEVKIMQNNIIIDDVFIESWGQKYDKIEGDDETYKKIVEKVKQNISKIGTISSETFEDIYNWKAARAKGYVNWDNYHKYDEVFRIALQAPKDKKIEILIDLSGVGVPFASTILHFIYPKIFPIVDFRTVEVLQNAGYLEKSKSLYHFRNTIQGYGLFCSVILDIGRQNKKRSLRQIDKSLFAYHKNSEKSVKC